MKTFSSTQSINEEVQKNGTIPLRLHEKLTNQQRRHNARNEETKASSESRLILLSLQHYPYLIDSILT